jgi:hypothetical protein
LGQDLVISSGTAEVIRDAWRHARDVAHRMDLVPVTSEAGATNWFVTDRRAAEIGAHLAAGRLGAWPEPVADAFDAWAGELALARQVTAEAIVAAMLNGGPLATATDVMDTAMVVKALLPSNEVRGTHRSEVERGTRIAVEEQVERTPELLFGPDGKRVGLIDPTWTAGTGATPEFTEGGLALVLPGGLRISGRFLTRSTEHTPLSSAVRAFTTTVAHWVGHPVTEGEVLLALGSVTLDAPVATLFASDGQDLVQLHRATLPGLAPNGPEIEWELAVLRPRAHLTGPSGREYTREQPSVLLNLYPGRADLDVLESPDERTSPRDNALMLLNREVEYSTGKTYRGDPSSSIHLRPGMLLLADPATARRVAVKNRKVWQRASVWVTFAADDQGWAISTKADSWRCGGGVPHTAVRRTTRRPDRCGRVSWCGCCSGTPTRTPTPAARRSTGRYSSPGGS